MKKYVIVITFCLIGSGYAFSQAMKDYGNLIIRAEDFFANQQYPESAKAYKSAFDVFGGQGGLDDRYNAAKSYAMAGVVDSAFYHLIKLANATEHYGLSNIAKSETEPYFKLLHLDSRWPELISTINSNREVLEAFLDEELVTILDEVFEDDQQNRKRYIESVEKNGMGTDEANVLLKKMVESDSINLVKVSAILDERGWLGVDIVGDKGSMTMFLVIQHAKPEAQAKYLPVLKEAVKNGDAEAGNLAYLEDRVALSNGKKQQYGSQIGNNPSNGEMFVLPLEDPMNVDKRRKEVGLSTLEEYLFNYGLKWSAEEYIKNLPEIEKIYNEQKQKHSEE